MVRQPRQTKVRSLGGGQQVTAIVGADKIQILVGDLQDFKSLSPEEYDGEKMTFKCPLDLARTLEVIRHSEGSPYQTPGDQLRDAVQCWVTAYQELEKRSDPRITAWLHHARIQAETAWLERHHQEIYTAMHRLADHVMLAVAKGRFAQAHRALIKHWHEVRQIKDEDWREDYVDMIKGERGLVRVIRVLSRLGYAMPTDLIGALR